MNVDGGIDERVRRRIDIYTPTLDLLGLLIECEGEKKTGKQVIRSTELSIEIRVDGT